MAVVAYPYYRFRHPAFARLAKAMVESVLMDVKGEASE